MPGGFIADAALGSVSFAEIDIFDAGRSPNPVHIHARRLKANPSRPTSIPATVPSAFVARLNGSLPTPRGSISVKGTLRDQVWPVHPREKQRILLYTAMAAHF